LGCREAYRENLDPFLLRSQNVGQISEKPVAGTFEEASILFKDYKQLPSSKPLWAVAEQFRYLDILDQIKAKLQDLGQMKLFSFNL
jgi:hypothetical protein